MNTIRRILVAVDYTPDSDAAIEQAASLATQTGASLRLLHVLEALMYAAPEMTELANREPSFHIEATRKLDAVVRSLKERGHSQVDDEIAFGIAADVIVDHANQGKYDLLVIGALGRSSFRRAHLGIVTEQVIRRAQIPVLTVRSDFQALPRAS